MHALTTAIPADAHTRTTSIVLRRIRPGPRVFLFGVLAITLGGACLRASFLDHPMRYDESLNYYQFTSRSPAYILTHYNPGNHVLHTLMVRISTKFFGRTPLGLRFPAFVGGVLLIPVAALTAWVLFRDRWTALLAALAVAASSQLVEYSTNARGYIWLGLFATLAVACTSFALRRPQRTRRWLLWGIVCSLGAYTMPLMIYPVAGLVVACVLAVLRRGRSRRGQATLRGVMLGSVLCGLLTLALYLPILISMGPREVWGLRQMTVDVWGPRVGGFGSMMQAVWQAWTRDPGCWWAVLLAGGAVTNLVSAVRRPTIARSLPLIMLVVAVIVVAVQGAPLRSRAWMFAMPTFLICCVAGIGRLWRLRTQRTAPRTIAIVALCILGAAELSMLRTVAAQPFLCSEHDTQVDVPEIIAECRAFGGGRCALVMRYTPAANFYRDMWDMPNPLATNDPRTQRVYIVADQVDALDDLWNASVPGFTEFSEPQLIRRLSRASLYSADRRAATR